MGDQSIQLRDVTASDLPIFFRHQLDEDANRMAAFATRRDWNGFQEHWTRILGDGGTTIKTILVDGDVAGSVLVYVDEAFGEPEVAYWIGKEHWGRGVTTAALSQFLAEVTGRPLYARAAKDNVASLRVLEKCGFTISGEEREFSKARGEEVEAFVLRLDDR